MNTDDLASRARDMAIDLFSGVINDAIALALTDHFPCRLIKRGETPYLYRYYLKKSDSSEFGVFLHRFVSSDQKEDFHCHPWKWSFSIILRGAYEEERVGRFIRLDDMEDPRRLPCDIAKKTFKSFDVNLIERDDYHRVDLLAPDVWTLFVHGPREGDWRFVHRETGAVRTITTKTFDHAEVVAP
jgi:hypothetical protein